MIRHSLLLIYRNFKRFKSTFFINMIGLSTSLACVLLIFLWVNDEVHTDSFHEKNSRLFQVMENQQHAENIVTTGMTAGLVAETLPQEMPEVELATAVMHHSWFPKFILSAAGDQKVKAVGQFASKDFFGVFSYGLVQGDKDQVLSAKNAMMISEALALKLFHTTQNVVGRVVAWELPGLKKQVVISGVFKGTPAGSSEQFDFILSFDAWKGISPSVLDWGNDGTNTYVVLKEGTNLAQFNQKIAGYIKQKNGGANRQVFLRPYADGYLYGQYENGVQAGGRITYVRLFSIIAVFILVIACINFMNLSTAKASRRIKEVGIKKAMGASRKSLVFHYLGESMLTAFASLLIALMLVELLLAPFSNLTGKQLTHSFHTPFLLVAIGMALLTGLLAGSYPALYLSGFKPAAVLRGRLHSFGGELWARKGLVVFQFTTSVIMIIAVFVVYKQIKYVQHKNMGYEKDNVIYFDLAEKLNESREAFLAEVKKVPGIVNASSIDRRIIGSHNTTGGLSWAGKKPDEVVAFEIVGVNYGLLETLDIKVKEGRAFSSDFATDTAKIIFNEAAITAMGLQDPVGKTVKLWGTNLEILGVVKDFNFQSLHETVKPLFIRLQPRNTSIVMIRMEAGKEKEAIARVRNLYATFNPGLPFDYTFLDEDYQAQYAAEQHVSALSRYFAGLAILISCLGLFGLAAFTAERRRKEIGVRKVLGATELQIVYLLSADFTKLVLVSILIALPISYLLVKNWLDSFAYKIALEPGYFIGAGVLALLLAWLTVGMQAAKAASVNPSQCLKEE
ncbi:ABC transporter permease [Pontibacter liquoris]|uniref:ABC transporter permease n=1 Tax=Pontibacter liquoris TaxID=2905677 RepID=UPI001FA7A9DA|nr:ABC transporter permease [Pontibacter liquoris]